MEKSATKSPWLIHRTPFITVPLKGRRRLLHVRIFLLVWNTIPQSERVVRKVDVGIPLANWLRQTSGVSSSLNPANLKYLASLIFVQALLNCHDNKTVVTDVSNVELN